MCVAELSGQFGRDSVGRTRNIRVFIVNLCGHWRATTSGDDESHMTKVPQKKTRTWMVREVVVYAPTTGRNESTKLNKNEKPSWKLFVWGLRVVRHLSTECPIYLALSARFFFSKIIFSLLLLKSRVCGVCLCVFPNNQFINPFIGSLSVCMASVINIHASQGRNVWLMCKYDVG